MAKLERNETDETAARMNALHQRLDTVIAETRRLKRELERLHGRHPLAKMGGATSDCHRDTVRGPVGQPCSDASIH